MSVRFRFSRVFACLAVACAAGSLFAEEPYIVGLGALPSTILPSYATDVSADGSIVVGASRKPGTPDFRWEPFRWTRSTGLMSLGSLPGGQTDSSPYAISADGTTVVGEVSSSAARQPFRWTQSTGMIGLGGLPGQPVNGFARSVSANGDIVVGETRTGSSGTMAFRWSNAAGMEALGDLPGGSQYSAAYDCSADGNTIVGYSQSANGSEAFQWRTGVGMTGLGDLPGGFFYSSANAMTPSGDFVVGDSSSANGTTPNKIEAYLWSEQAGMIGLGDLPGGEFESSAGDVSADGTTVVGASWTAVGYQAFIWRADTGMMNLSELLADKYGLSLPGWRLVAARAISADGLTFVGEGVNPDGQIEGWVAHVPEPGTSGLMLVGLWALFARGLRSSSRRAHRGASSRQRL